MHIIKQADISHHSTLGIRASAHFLVTIDSSTKFDELYDFVQSHGLPTMALGGGSNVIFCSEYPGIIIKNSSQGIEQLTTTKVKVQAGTSWDEFVKYCTAKNLSGVEALSWIPGTVGGAIALNAGAYGQTVQDTLDSIRVFDVNANSMLKWSSKELHMWHRSSIFREKRGNNLVILDATFKLNRTMQIPNHPKIEALNKDLKSSPKTLRESVINLRSHLPDPQKVRNVGSFFLNPTVPNRVAKKLANRFPTISMRPFDTEHYQIATGWLLDNAGLKGQTIGNFMLHPEHANIVINKSAQSNGKDVVQFIHDIQAIIYERFGLLVVAEPLLVGEEFWQGSLFKPTLHGVVETF